MNTTQQIDWAPYKNQASNLESEEGWMYRVACYVVDVSLDQARDIARTILTLPPEIRCVWHGVWVYRGSTGKCPCASCCRQIGGVK